jgi:peptidoglycan glycosyltransferase
VTVARIDTNLGRIQAIWTAASVAAFVLTLLFVRRIRTLERYRYTFLFLGTIALLLPLAPGIGKTINGARLWVGIGPVNFQPGEAAKVMLVLFFAAYLVDKRELLASGTRRLGPLRLPAVRHLGPLLLAWGVSILVMVRETDLGQAMIVFALCGIMLYVATDRAAYTLIAAVLFIGASVIAYQAFGHVQTRVQTWVDPFRYANDKGYQLVQGLFGFAAGGFGGTGLGLGNPKQIPNAATDFVFAAIGEELGLLGAVAILIALLLLIGAGLRIAMRAERPFPKLFATGLTAIIGLQSFVIIGGVTRTIPLTGVTLPFISYGGSSLVANWVILALLLRISDDTARAAQARRSTVVARAP